MAPGFALPSAMNSASVLAGTDGFTARKYGAEPSSVTGTKSLSVS